MGKHKAITISRYRLGGGVLLGAVASGALAVAALSSAGVANATCASISGVGNGNGCTTSGTSFAVGLGPNTAASAQGTLNGSIAAGNGAVAATQGTANLAVATGAGSQAGC